MRPRTLLTLGMLLCSLAPAASAGPGKGGGTLQGRLVRGAPSAPVAGTVEVHFEGMEPRRAVAGEDGWFSVADLPRMTPGVLIASSAGTTPARFSGVFLPPRSPLDLDDVLLGAPVPLEVTVATANGPPPDGARVEAFRETPWPCWVRRELLPGLLPPTPAGAVAECDATGRARIVLPGPGRWGLRCSAPGFADAATVVSILEGEERSPVALVLGPGHPLEGVVRWTDGSPAEGVLLVASAAGAPAVAGPGEPSVATDRKGRFSFANLAAGRWNLSVRVGNLYRLPLPPVDVPAPSALRFELPRPATLKGVLLDGATGKGVPDAVLVPQIMRKPDWRLLPVIGRTDGAGRFELAGVPPGEIYHLEISADGYRPLTDLPTGMAANTVLPEGGAAELTLHAERGATLSGRVLDPEGNAISRALVSLTCRIPDGGPLPLPPVRTGRDGRYEIQGVLPERSLLLVEAPGWFQEGAPESDRVEQWNALRDGTTPSCTVDLPGTGECSKDVRLLPAASVEGVVADEAGDPVPGFRITVWPVVGEGEDRPGGQGGSPGVSDQEGRYRVTDLRPGASLFAWASGPGGVEGQTTPFALAAGQRRTGTGIGVLRGAVLEGRVVQGDGAVPRGARLRLASGENRFKYPWDEEEWRKAARDCPVGADGRFRIEGLRPGTYTVLCTAEGCAAVEGPVVTVSRGVKPEPVEVILPPGSAVAGRVLDREDHPVPGATVLLVPRPEGGAVISFDGNEYLVRHRALSDADGRFRIGSLGSGTFRVIVRATGFAAAGFTAAPGEEELALRLDASRAIAGRVTLAEDGTPAAGIQVEADEVEPPAGFWRRVTTHTTADGSFSLEGLPPGAFSVKVGDVNNPQARFVDVPPVRVESGTTDLQVTVKQALSIAGRVLDTDGAPARVGATITITEPGNISPTLLYGKTAEDGSFRISGLKPGPYKVEVRPNSTEEHSYLDRTVVPVQAGTEDLIVTLAEGGYVSGTVLGHDGKPVRRVVELGLSPVGFSKTKEDGTFRLGPLPLGEKVDLWAECQTGVGTGDGPTWTMGGVVRDVPVGSRDVLLPLQAGKRISGRILDEEGVPPPVGTWVVAWQDWKEGEETSEEMGTVGIGETRADGTFDILGLGDFSFRLEVGGFMDTREILEPALHEAGETGIQLRLRKTYTLKGRLVDKEGRVSEAKVIMAVSLATGWRKVELLRGSDGSFSIENLPAGRYRLSAALERFGDKEADLGEVEVPCEALKLTVKWK